MSNVNALDVAKYFLLLARQNGDLLTHLKIQKLLYYAQAWYLVNYDKPLFDDVIEAWDYGPVVRRVWRAWNRYGSAPITVHVSNSHEDMFNRTQRTFLNEFFGVFSNFSATALVNMSHQEKPWKDAYDKSTRCGVISHDSMRVFYSDLYKRLNANPKRP